MKPLLVGEDNPYGSDPRYALYPEPEHSAGGRLCRLIMGLSIKDYVRSFDRANLCSRRWSMPEARERARALVKERAGILVREATTGVGPLCTSATFVLLGAKVCAAFSMEYQPFAGPRHLVSGCQVVILPHPSGRNRLWNESGALERARAVLKLAGALALPCRWCERTAGCECPTDDEGGLLRTEYTTRRPARCSNCGIVVRGAECPDCGPPR